MRSVYGKYFVKAALMWAGCFVLFFLAYMFVLVPQRDNRKQFEKQLAEKKQMYEFALKAAQKETQEQLKEQIEQLRNKLKNFVVDSGDSANLTFAISRIASEKQVAAFSIDTRKGGSRRSAKSDKYISEDRIDISFSTEDFNQFAALLNVLERHQPVIFVDGFSITRSGKTGSAHRVNMNLAVFVRRTQDS